MFKIFIAKGSPKQLKEDEVKKVFWKKPDSVLEDMQMNPEKYTEGFKSTIKVFFEHFK